MTSLNDVLDAIVDLSTGSAEFLTEKWRTGALVFVAVLAMIAILVLFYMSPLYGVAGLLAAVVIVAILSQNDGDTLV
jgi:ABC-type protease/lipase transport system fused ATPase/permease subunit